RERSTTGVPARGRAVLRAAVWSGAPRVDNVACGPPPASASRHDRRSRTDAARAIARIRLRGAAHARHPLVVRETIMAKKFAIRTEKAPAPLQGVFPGCTRGQPGLRLGPDRAPPGRERADGCDGGRAD